MNSQKALVDSESDAHLEAQRSSTNVHAATVRGFGFEWSRFDQSGIDDVELHRWFDAYFAIFPWDLLPAGGGVGADVGCGSGRWSKLVAPRAAQLHLIDASEDALAVARRNLGDFRNVQFHLASADRLPFPDGSLDFAFSLGVLHHVPDTAGAIKSIARKLRPGAPFLVYLYYAMDNRPAWYRHLWRISYSLRAVISRMPPRLRSLVAEIIAASVYWPLARSGKVLKRSGVLRSKNWPLSSYSETSYYVMRTDALDRFGTRLEQRFTRAQIGEMLKAAGFENIRFSDQVPYWCAIGLKAPEGHPNAR